MHLVILESDADASAVAGQLLQRLLEFNEAQIGPRHTHEFALTIRDDHRNIVGGLSGEFLWNALYITVLWVSESSRGQGYGSALMHAAEDMARKRECDVLFLSTMTFQAPDFYRKLGFSPIGELVDAPKGFSRVWFAKRLSEARS